MFPRYLPKKFNKFHEISLLCRDGAGVDRTKWLKT
jgi:hypothetical protein